MRNFRAGAFIGFVVGTLWLCGCSGNSNPQVPATVILSKDKSQFSGNVVRSDSSSITLVGDGGVTRTFLFTEVSDIRYGAPGQKTDVSPVPQPAASLPEDVATVVSIPAGTQIPVRAAEFIDSCCTPVGTIEIGLSDADVQGPGGKILIPEGANLTFVVRDKTVVDGRDTLQFELSSADFANRHYSVSSADGGQKPGAVVTIAGPRYVPGSDDTAKTLHLEHNALLQFQAETPVAMKLSQ